MTLREAADRLFRPDALPDEFFEHMPTGQLRTAIVLREISFRAGQQEE